MSKMRSRVCVIACMAFVSVGSFQRPRAYGEVQPPAGFRALFDGESLEGWFGMPHFDPRKYWEMSEQERAAYRAGNQEALEAHWTIQDAAVVTLQGPELP